MFIIVVNQLTAVEQKFIRKLDFLMSQQCKQTKLIIVHNFANVKTTESAKKIWKQQVTDIFLNAVPFTEPAVFNNTKVDVPCILTEKHGRKINHIYLVNHNCLIGPSHNEPAFDVIR